MSDLKLQLAPPEALGLCPVQWRRVLAVAEKYCKSGAIPALSFQVQRRGMTTGIHHFGSRTLDSREAVDDETIFLVASLTKPMLAMATMLLVERGEISLSLPVCDVLPDFRDAAKRAITIRHLLTHTSGLPDMLPNNLELRRSRSPLESFVKGACEAELLFPPGRSAQYQSMGYAVLGAVIEKITGKSCRDYMRDELFLPIGMEHSWLGLSSSQSDDPKLTNRIAEVQVPASQQGGEDWNWNSRYWRELGAPWGGVLTTTSDISRFCRKLLMGGNVTEEHRIFSSATIRQSLGNRLDDFTSIPDSERRTRGWGLGWRLNWKDHRSCFTDLLPYTLVGHWGATGTLFWLERRREIGVVLLSTRPLDEKVSPLTVLSNMIAASFLDN